MFRLYDTRLREVSEIRPAGSGQLRMYACGPTVYRYAHLGNLRAFLLPDLIRRNAERQVNDVLGALHPDYAALRRYLVDEHLMDRAGGEYWRIGGPVRP